MTIRLYDKDVDMLDFSAVVKTCAQRENGYGVTLDQTAFFPEGGGQPADTGVLGGARVQDVQIPQEAIVHYTDAPLTPGAQVRGEIDRPQRYRRKQGHSGEHIISGLIHSEYGLDNVGFHLGEDTITMDYNGELTWPQLMHIEQLANEAVYRNVPIRTEYPSPEQLAQMTYRSKLDLTEDVRIVTVEGYDVCACCAPHVSCTGEIGAIKFTSVMRHRGGIRVTILCGADAEVDYREKSAQVAALSAQLSVRQADVVPAVQRLLDEIAQLKAAAAELEHRLNAQRLQQLHETPGSICVIDRFDDPVAMREFVNAGMLLAGGVCAAFTGSDADGYRYIIGSRTVDLRTEAKTINAAISGRGGGKPTMIQGSCTAPAAALEAFEMKKFARDAEAAEKAATRVERMLECELMILDDLGTEMLTQISISALYTLINTRHVEGKTTIISTNLTDAELARRYTPQICSRIDGEFLKLPFAGTDIRKLKKEM